MRFGLQLLVAGMVASLATMASAEGDEVGEVIVERVDATGATQSFPPDLSGLEEGDVAAEQSAPSEALSADEVGDDAMPSTEEDAEWSGVHNTAAADEGAEAVEDDLWDSLDEVADDETVADDSAAWEGDEASDVAVSETMGDADASESAPTEPQIEEGTSVVVGGVELGPVGIDSEGRVGRVHTIKPGDTLWDVSHAYLGTSWVWPSVWSDNDGIANPHMIEPGDRLWISSTEIRAITDEEADAYVAEAELAVTEEPEPMTVAAEIDEDAMDFEEIEEEDEFLDMAAMDEFASEEMEQLPVGMSDGAGESNDTGRVLRVSMRENMSFVSDVQLEASTSILDSPSDRRFLSAEDTIYLGLGEGEVEVGDHYTLFRDITEVRSPSNKSLIGYHVEVLGWAEVTEVTGDASVAVIRTSLDGAERGDRVMPRYQMPTDIKVKYAEEGIDGEIAFLPASRTLMGTIDYVFVDIGAVHGVEIGTDLEVYDGGSARYDEPRDVDVVTPDRVVADLVVVTVQEDSAVAFVAHARRALAVGDTVRGATRHFPDAF